jgi:chemotaxis signal transduction protein
LESFPHRGRELPLVDLRERFLVADPGAPRAVLVALPLASPDPLALLVDEVDAVISIDTESLLELPDPLHRFLGAHLQGLCVLPGETGADAPEVIALLGPVALGIEAATRSPGGVP